MTPAPFHQLHNDRLPAAEAFFTKADDGVQLRLACWRTHGAAHGSVLLFPGRTEYVEKYSQTAARLNAVGLTVLAIDWRGQGLSDRLQDDPRPGHIGDFSDYQRDVVEMVVAATELDLPRPWHLLAHSMGGCIGLAALHNELPVQTAAFSAPMWGINLRQMPHGVALGMAYIAGRLGRGGHAAPGSGASGTYVLDEAFSANLLTHDAAEWARMVCEADAWPDLTIGGASFDWVAKALNECTRLSGLPSPDYPVMVSLGDGEKVVSSSAIRDRVERWPDAQLLSLARCRHEAMMETTEVREQFFQTLLAHIGAT
ncbi:alpha/beta hydrolase [Paracoccus sp. M683]|uniref:alpha/beta fold hydrolase n=1 Tax=Paracoccus sp. M683 TaxID=2594268 RepID=UPI00117ECEED|nr:alpha/beta hydrolase [Paracoccus sp. M683]TRW96883.1 alpha/beta hydrolase [Paracoccus sp. M683]